MEIFANATSNRFILKERYEFSFASCLHRQARRSLTQPCTILRGSNERQTKKLANFFLNFEYSVKYYSLKKGNFEGKEEFFLNNRTNFGFSKTTFLIFPTKLCLIKTFKDKFQAEKFS